MENYFKIMAGILITMILCLLLPKQKTDTTILLCLAVCAMALVGMLAYMQPVIDLYTRLVSLGNLPEELLGNLLKITGIGLLSQIATVICMDAGNQSLAKTLQILTTTVVLWLCIPLLEQTLSLLENILRVT